jgi:hypothetical protein
MGFLNPNPTSVANTKKGGMYNASYMYIVICYVYSNLVVLYFCFRIRSRS